MIFNIMFNILSTLLNKIRVHINMLLIFEQVPQHGLD